MAAIEGEAGVFRTRLGVSEIEVREVEPSPLAEAHSAVPLRRRAVITILNTPAQEIQPDPTA